MIKKYKRIEHIKAVIWGEERNTIIIAVHGDQSNKEDVCIFANSMGAYFSMVAFENERIEKSCFLTLIKYIQQKWVLTE